MYPLLDWIQFPFDVSTWVKELLLKTYPGSTVCPAVCVSNLGTSSWSVLFIIAYCFVACTHAAHILIAILWLCYNCLLTTCTVIQSPMCLPHIFNYVCFSTFHILLASLIALNVCLYDCVPMCLLFIITLFSSKYKEESNSVLV